MGERFHGAGAEDVSRYALDPAQRHLNESRAEDDSRLLGVEPGEDVEPAELVDEPGVEAGPEDSTEDLTLPAGVEVVDPKLYPKPNPGPVEPLFTFGEPGGTSHQGDAS